MSLKFHNFYIKYLLLCSVVLEAVIVIEAIAKQAFLSLLLFSAFNILGFITGYVLQKQRRIGLQLVKIRSIIGIVIASILYLLALASFYSSRNEMFKKPTISFQRAEKGEIAIFDGIIDIDCGAAYPEYGVRLCCFCLDTQEVIYQNIE